MQLVINQRTIYFDHNALDDLNITVYLYRSIALLSRVEDIIISFLAEDLLPPKCFKKACDEIVGIYIQYPNDLVLWRILEVLAIMLKDEYKTDDVIAKMRFILDGLRQGINERKEMLAIHQQ